MEWMVATLKVIDSNRRIDPHVYWVQLALELAAQSTRPRRLVQRSRKLLSLASRRLNVALRREKHALARKDTASNTTLEGKRHGGAVLRSGWRA